MVTSEGLAIVDPWLYRQGFNVDSWLLAADTFSHDNDLLTRSLHATTSTTAATPAPLPSVLFPSHPSSTHTLSSNIADREIIGGGVKQKRNCLLTQGSKATKRRSRASKKSQTTFITTNPSNFRHMVQQVTGAKYNDGIFAPIAKPEPRRLVHRLPDRSTAVRTLETSAFLSRHHEENLAVGNTFSGNSIIGLPSAETNATLDAVGSAVDSDTYPTFPTLESWKVT